MSSASDSVTLESLKAARDRLILSGTAEITTPGGTVLKFTTLAELERMIQTYELRVTAAASGRYGAVDFGGAP